ncbi:hypothetical protein ACFWR9_20760 [Streptomyces sp. NPDC058534]|uniref:hypothetical protein n=1 Tax=Streptomyces sp. NPDC058534 TaxID=3346541 RepID=UPI00364D8414
MSQRRYTASDITDDALDALYENANEGWRRGDCWKDRAEQAQAAVARARAVAQLVRSRGVPTDEDMGQWDLAGAVLDATELSEENSTK